jgi:hypothetical protein
MLIVYAIKLKVILLHAKKNINTIFQIILCDLSIIISLV